MLTTQLHLAPMLRMIGAVPLLPLVRLLGIHEQLYLYLYGQERTANITGNFKTECERSEKSKKILNCEVCTGVRLTH